MRQRTIFLFWLPLFTSWLLMTLEGPIVSAAINRLPNEIVMLAAMGIVVSLSVTIESPIINMLATSTALSNDRPSYLLLRKFTIHWMILLTGVSILLAWTSLFDLLIVDLMGIPEEVAFWVRPGLRIMTFWSAAIAWRRFLQGVMIRYNQTRKVAWGTVVRLLSSGGTVIVLATSSQLPGVVIGSLALMAGVISEAIFASIAVHPILTKELSPSGPISPEKPLTYKGLSQFHLPLAATSVLLLLIQPMVAFTLARSPQPTQSLAAWPIVFQVMLVARAAAFALPEVIIALTDGRATFLPLRRFTYTLVIVNSAAMLLFVLTPLSDFYLLRIQDADPAIANLAKDGLLIFLPLPALAILISWIRGLLINRRVTTAVNVAMIINLILTITILIFSVSYQWPGIPGAAVALSLSAAVELIYISWRVGGALDFQFRWFEFRKNPVPS
ncbi:MAG: hypothetical protein BMS9Abin02_1604 [Anaerolineae bacterium]|nr:MAG: hypothetical protein BMS9Abin02_1604 [Anaerolineae bacterium]